MDMEEILYPVTLWLLCICIGLTIFLVQNRKGTKAREIALQEEISSLKQQVERYELDVVEVSRDRWLHGLPGCNYRNELEVEIKFVYPLLRFLGYEPNTFQVRVPVTVQMGRNQSRGEADWVIWDPAAVGERSQAQIVIEAKEPGQSLDSAVQGQARSYAFGLNAPWYVLTNGRQLKIYRRGVQRDTCIVDCNVDDLPETWSEIKQTIGIATG